MGENLVGFPDTSIQSNMHNQNSLIVQRPSIDSTWTIHDHSMFVNAVANESNGLEEMAIMIPGKTSDEVKEYYEAVARELLEIEAGRVELPDYPDGDSYPIKIKQTEPVVNASSGSKPQEKERKKANPWTVDEHKRFLEGLKKYGRGDWRSISRMAVVTRTATQVASHAQKFFLRQQAKEGNNNNTNNNKKRKKKRYSIHDITTTDTAVVAHAQPMTTSTPPVATFYDGKGKGVPPTTSSSGYFSGGRYYGGQGMGALPPLITPLPYSFCDGQGGEAPQPFSSYYDRDGQGGAPAPPGNEVRFNNSYPGETNL